MKILLSLMLLVSIGFAEKVRVTEQTEITRPFVEKVKTGEQCYEDTVRIPINCGNDTNSIGLDTVVGIVIGGAIGNQIGKGNGRDAARIIGGLGGGYIANQTRNNGCYSYETVTKCNPKYEYKSNNRIIGWNNCAYIDGQKYCKQTKQPVSYLNIRKTVTVY
jgi:uncharacterized protein YcfJ